MDGALRPALGLLIGSSAGIYAQKIIHNVHGASREFGLRMTCFVCEFLRYYNDDIDSDDVILDLIEGSKLDALIIAGMLSDKVLEKILQRTNAGEKQIPVITLTCASESAHSVLVNNTAAMHLLMEHLLDHHGYERFAFIGGPEGQKEAEQRKSVFIEEILKRKLGLRDDWIVHGNFHTVSGITAMKELLRSEDPSFQVVVAATDQMAAAAQKYLESIGRKVPDDICITGFDDFLPSSLTTVHQPLKLQIRTAVDMICRKMDGQDVPRSVELPSSLKLRSSCGCCSLDLLDQLPETLIRNKIMMDCFQQLEAVFKTAVKDRSPGAFLSQLNEYIGDETTDFTGTEWRAVFMLIEKSVLPDCQDSFDRTLVEHLLDRALTLVMDAPLNNGTVDRFFSEDESFTVQSLNQKLNNLRSMGDMFDLLATELPGLGFVGARLALLPAGEKIGGDNPLDQARTAILKLAYDNDGRQEIPELGHVFPLNNLPPDLQNMTDDRALVTVVQPLYFHQELKGIMVVDTDSIGVNILDGVISNISNAVHSIMLLDERNRSEARMIQSEKMAALGTMVAGIAHEINTPLGIGRTTSGEIRQQAEDILANLQSNSLSRSDFDDFLAVLIEGTQLIEHNLVRAAELIASFKKIAVDQSSGEIKQFNLGRYLADVVLSLKPKLKKDRYHVRLECPETIHMYGPPGTIAQIISNLVCNSLAHAFGDQPHGEMSISCSSSSSSSSSSDSVHIVYSDNGSGMDATVLQEIFKPFFSTRLAEGGSGLGLHIVYELISTVWQGSIHCESSPGEGTRFFMTFRSDIRNPEKN